MLLVPAAPSVAQKGTSSSPLDPALARLKTEDVKEAPAQKLEVEDPAPSFSGGKRAGDVIKGRYIVTLKRRSSGVKARAEREADEHGGDVKRVYKGVFQGFLGTFSKSEAAELERDSSVRDVEPDRIVSLSGTQSAAPWGLDRIDQHLRPLNRTYSYGSDGAGTHIYVLDTGLRADHQDFAGRVGNGYNATAPGASTDDCQGHGTHVAGTAAGTTWGVAKQATVHPVKVFSNCSGSTTQSTVVAALDWVRLNHVKPAVANLSLGAETSSTTLYAQDLAVEALVDAGVTVAVAAGNSTRDACFTTPAHAPKAITAGATTPTDSQAYYSNFGPCVDVYAPGSGVQSAGISGPSATTTLSGTSMASPHVAGVAATILGATPKNVPTPAQVAQRIADASTKGVLTGLGGGSPNALLFNSPPVAPPPAPPAATPPPVVVNGGFENGTLGWTQAPANLISAASPPAKTGAWGAWLGGFNNAQEGFFQKITVPANGVLTYSFMCSSTDSDTVVRDLMYVRLYNTDGGLLQQIRAWSQRGQRDTWRTDTLNLSPYAGRTVLLWFGASTDSSAPTSYYVDEIRVG